MFNAVLSFDEFGEGFGADRERVDLLDKLLVRAELLSSHNDVAEFRVDLGVETSVTDEIDDPALGLLLVHVQLVSEHPEIDFALVTVLLPLKYQNLLAGDALMYATECLENHQSRALDEFVQVSVDEEIVHDDVLALMELSTCTLEVEVDVQVLEELGDWILVRVRLLLDDFDQILECIATTSVDDNGYGEIAQDVRTRRLNDIQVDRLVQKHLDDEVAAFRVMEEDQDAPVNEPSALCQKLHVAERAVVDELAQTIEVFQSRHPVECENLSGQFAPQNVQVVLVVRLHDHLADVQILCRLGVVSAIVHVLGELVHALDDVNIDLKREKLDEDFHFAVLASCLTLYSDWMTVTSIFVSFIVSRAWISPMQSISGLISACSSFNLSRTV